jgi:hypothetical protein
VKGVLFNIVEDVVDDTLPEDSWDLALERAHVAGAYTSLGDYPDAELGAIVSALSERTGLEPADVLRHAGRHGFAHLATRHADLLAGVDGLGPLLGQLDDVIHPEVLKLYPEAAPPTFTVHEDDPGRWTVRYRSSRGLCHLAEGLVLGAADHYGTPASVEQTSCVHRGDDDCVLVVEAAETP